MDRGAEASTRSTLKTALQSGDEGSQHLVHLAPLPFCSLRRSQLIHQLDFSASPDVHVGGGRGG